jgi:hypothetical protein
MDTSAGDTGDNIRVEDIVAVKANTWFGETRRTSGNRKRVCWVVQEVAGIEVK